MEALNIDFEPIGRRGACGKGQSLLDCARQLGVSIVSICGGQGEPSQSQPHLSEKSFRPSNYGTAGVWPARSIQPVIAR
jgi:uncharacterized 2Fe-2S/4Fe-4S cluster protein (DUF4445 family)